MNNCVFIGNLTADPELRYSTAGKPITNFSIAINERSKGEEVTEFLDFMCFEKQAETVAEFGRKGRKIGVIAAYHTDHWNDRETGQKRSKVRFYARNVEFLDKPPENVAQRQQQQQPPQGQGQYQPIDDPELDELPF